MKSINLLKTIGLSFVLSCTTIYVQLNSTTAPETSKTTSTGHKLTNPMMTALDTLIKMSPKVMLEVNVSLQRLNSILKRASLPKNKTIKNALDLILAPVQHLFELLTKHATKIRPLVEESLKIHNHTNQPLLIAFFDSGMLINDFCTKEVTTMEQFQKMGTEIADFFNDLNASISSETKKMCLDLEEQIKNAKK